MPNYSSELFSPPAPLAFVTVKSARTNQLALDVPMLLDTGADVSFMPAKLVQHLFASNDTNPQYEIQAFDGSRSVAPAAILTMLFQGKSFRGQFLLFDQTYGVIGRNVLNSLVLNLNGPVLTWETA